MPWKRALLRWMPRDMTLTELYNRLGWTNKGAWQVYVNNPNLRLSLAIKMADCIGAPRLRFLRTLLEEMEREPGLLPPAPRTKLRHPRSPIARRVAKA